MRLFLCEKPSQGKDIAHVLRAAQPRNGHYIGPNVIVTWCIGHLVEAAPPEAYGEHYKHWSIEHLPIIPDRWRHEIKSSTAAQFRIIRDLLASSSDLVIATDADREGEMIAREILELCGYRGAIQRLWLSALNETSIRKALAQLRPGNETLPLYHAALARSRADWLVGMNLSRLFTVLGRKAGHDGVLSVGRVQTPTLNLVVQRDREIARFVAVPYWSIDVTLSASGRSFVAQWIPPQGATDSDGRCTQQHVAQQAADQLQQTRTAQVTSVITERIRELPPLPFDLSTLQETCSRRLGLDVQETLNIAQALYETHKATTYPRSDSGHLPQSMFGEVPTVLAALVATDPTIRPLIELLDVAQRSRAWDDSKVTAHHGIIPTLEPANLSAMSDKERAVYQLIRAHYLAQLLPPHEYDRTTAQFSCANMTLRAIGKQVIVRGWRLALDPLRVDADRDEHAAGDMSGQALPPLVNGTCCVVDGVELKALKTQPPKPYTQGELIKAMKNVARLVSDPRLKQKLKDTTGIGTEATRAGIIQTLIGRSYLLTKKRAVRASQAAFTLIDAIPSAIADPGTTALWEQALDLIAARQMTIEDFVAKQSAWVSQLVREHRTATLKLHQTDAPTCPECRASMRTRTGKHGAFWSCARYPKCNGTMPMTGVAKRRASSSHK